MLNKIINEIGKEGFDVNGVIQHSYNPHVNDSVQFYVYSKNEISHIVSTYRNPTLSRQRMHDQNKTMHLIFDRVDTGTVKRSILFDSWLLNLPGGCFRIQRFKKCKFRFRVSNYSLNRLEKYLNLSTKWLVDFQRATRLEGDEASPDDIKNKILFEIDAHKKKRTCESEIISFLSVLAENLGLIQTNLRLCARHGDYCYWNCFVDTDDVFRVIDWEFAGASDWVISDYLSNLLVLWIDLKRQGVLTGTIQNMFKPCNSVERILSQNLMGFIKLYSLSLPEIRLYLVYMFINIYMRQTRPVAEKYWSFFLDDIISVLN